MLNILVSFLLLLFGVFAFIMIIIIKWLLIIIYYDSVELTGGAGFKLGTFLLGFLIFLYSFNLYLFQF